MAIWGHPQFILRAYSGHVSEISIIYICDNQRLFCQEVF